MDIASRPLRPPPKLATARLGAPTTVASTAPAPVRLESAGRLEADKFTMHMPKVLTFDTDRRTPMVVTQDGPPDCHCAGRSWWVRYHEGDASRAPVREVRLVIDHNGYIAATETIDRTEKVEVVYTPPLVVVPDKLPPKGEGGARFAQEVRMVVHPLGDRSKVRMQGTATNEIVFEGDEQLQTGAGEFTAHRITAVVTATLGGARTVDVSEQWLVDGIGLAAEREQEETRVLGAKVRDNTMMMLLKSYQAK